MDGLPGAGSTGFPLRDDLRPNQGLQVLASHVYKLGISYLMHETLTSGNNLPVLV
jgi:hypothetical protein